MRFFIVDRRFNSSVLLRAKYWKCLHHMGNALEFMKVWGEDLMTMKYAQIAISKEHSIESCN